MSKRNLEARDGDTDNGREVRFATGLQVRAGDGDNPPTVEGYAAVFDEETRIGDWFVEVIRAGAFKSALARGDDVVFLINHDGLPLARTRSGTLELKEDKKGLHMRAELDPDDPDVQRIVPKMERGDLDKMSFAFWPEQETWTDRDGDGELPLREITDLRLHDVAIVTTPAYNGTEIGLRGLQRYKDQQSDKGGAIRRRRMRMKTELAARNAKET